MKKHFSIIVTGKVQGVFFRASAKEKADALQICGRVRNEGNGNVFIEAEGEEEVLASFVQWCRQGPPLARVDHCSIDEGSLKHYAGFAIER